MKKLIAIIAIIASFGGQAQQYIDAGNTQVVGVVEDSISNPINFLVLDANNKFRKISKDSIGGNQDLASVLSEGSFVQSTEDGIVFQIAMWDELNERYTGVFGLDVNNGTLTPYNALVSNLGVHPNTSFGRNNLINLDVEESWSGNNSSLTAFGANVMRDLEVGARNTGIGADAIRKIVSGDMTTAIGAHSASDALIANRSTIVGQAAAENAEELDGATIIGRRSASNSKLIEQSIIISPGNIGSDDYITEGELINSVYIGRFFPGVGDNENTTIENKIVISDGEGNIALDANMLTNEIFINGYTRLDSLSVSNYKFPITDGTGGQVLQTDGNGNVNWQSVSSGSVAWDEITGDQSAVSLSGFDNIISEDITINAGAPGVTFDGSAGAHLTFTEDGIIQINRDSGSNVEIASISFEQYHISQMGGYTAPIRDVEYTPKKYVDDEIGNLGTMASENADDYYTQTQVNDTLSNYPLYSEGTFTGAFEGSTSGSVSTGTQNYLRTGNWVTVEIACKGIDLTSLAGDVRLTGLPNFSLAVQNGASATIAHGINIAYPTGSGNQGKTLMLIIDSGVAFLGFTNDEGDFIPLNNGYIKGATNLYITLTYRIA